MTSSLPTQGNRELKKVKPLVDEVLSYKDALEGLPDADLRHKTFEFRNRLKVGETLNDILPEAYAVVRETARRVLGMEHYPVQIAGGIVLHQGGIAEMATGEGKTLVATLPAYLNALEGNGVHIVTVNDYLAERDRYEMGQVYDFLGLSVGVVLGGMSRERRKEMYGRDIIYITNHELGFDYLRDNMAKRRDHVVQRGLSYAIVDEVDSVLIDDARTPLIISGEGRKSTKLYEACDTLVKRMERGEDLPLLTKMDIMAGMRPEETGDFIVLEKDKSVILTEQGMARAEHFFRIDNIADSENSEIMHHMDAALRANYLMKRDRDYIVKDGEVLIVDENTGRVMPGRRFSDGIHQAIEAKEGVRIQKESRTVATITYQSFFNKYDKIAGMTGTGMPEREEFKKTYGMDVISIPTNRPVQRIDRADVVFKTRHDKMLAVCDEIEECLEVHRPVLVGTASVGESEELSEELERRGIPHSVLNAKNHEEEAGIVAEAGRRGAITISTNMAGRGTDIKLDDDAREAGGLLVIGLQRHESSRIDGQLRGRSGRQGDPGESRFYLSVEDDLLRLYGPKRLMSFFDHGAHAKNAVESPQLTRMVEQAQRAIEGDHFEIRKRLLDFDKVVDAQRETIYRQRREVLFEEDLRPFVVRMIEAVVEDAMDSAEGAEWEDRTHMVLDYLSEIMSPQERALFEGLDYADLEEPLVADLVGRYDYMEGLLEDDEVLRKHERAMLLEAVDSNWEDHLDDIEHIKTGIGLVGYAKLDPVVEFEGRTSEMFEEMSRNIRLETVLAVLCPDKAGSRNAPRTKVSPKTDTVEV